MVMGWLGRRNRAVAAPAAVRARSRSPSLAGWPIANRAFAASQVEDVGGGGGGGGTGPRVPPPPSGALGVTTADGDVPDVSVLPQPTTTQLAASRTADRAARMRIVIPRQ